MKKMVKKHMKRQTAPVTWRINRKGSKFVVRPKPGKAYNLSMPLSLVFKNILKYCRTTKEVKSILHDKNVRVDLKRRKDFRYSVGLMDIISMEVSNEFYRMILNEKGKLDLVGINKKESNIKPLKLTGKSKLKKGITQLNFFDGKNILLNKKDNYRIGDTLVIDISENKIMEHLEYKKGNYAMLTAGNHIGQHGVIQDANSHLVKIKNKQGKVIPAFIKHAYVIGKDKPVIKLKD